MARYTLYTGEPIITASCDTPGPMFWGWTLQPVRSRAIRMAGWALASGHGDRSHRPRPHAGQRRRADRHRHRLRDVRDLLCHHALGKRSSGRSNTSMWAVVAWIMIYLLVIDLRPSRRRTGSGFVAFGFAARPSRPGPTGYCGRIRGVFRIGRRRQRVHDELDARQGLRDGGTVGFIPSALGEAVRAGSGNVST